jgi:hypothetical protein
VAARHLGDGGHVVHDAGRGFAQRGEDDLDAVVLGQEAVDLGGLQALTPARLVADGLPAVGLAQLDPALAELAGRAGQHGHAGANEVGGGGVHGARSAGGEREHVVARAKTPGSFRSTRS